MTEQETNATQALPRIRLAAHPRAEDLQIRSPRQIARVLQDLARQHALVTAYPEKSNQFAVTAVLAASADDNTLVLDEMPDEALSNQVISGATTTCVALHGRAPVEFICPLLRRGEFDGAPALLGALPTQMWRLQRRQAYRVPTPVANPIKCRLSRADGTEVSVSLVDLSVGGVGLIDYENQTTLHPGERFAGARIALPDYGLVVCDLVVRNTYPLER
ncbi:MAG: hypothetical protein AMJ69_11635, partial [Gammaproteobacteria bacterium SG8_47]